MRLLLCFCYLNKSLVRSICIYNRLLVQEGIGMDKAVIDTVKQSFGRALGDRDLLGKFYDRLLNSNPEIGKAFVNVDMEKQKEILQMSLSMAILYPQDNVVAKHSMDKVRVSHNQANLNIKPEMYQYWLDALLSAVAESDPDFTAELDQQWRTVMGVVIDHISSGYLENAG